MRNVSPDKSRMLTWYFRICLLRMNYLGRVVCPGIYSIAKTVLPAFLDARSRANHRLGFTKMKPRACIHLDLILTSG